MEKSQETIKKVKMSLIGVDGNVFVIMGVFRRKARLQGWTLEQVEDVLNEAMEGSYDHLVQTIMSNIED